MFESDRSNIKQNVENADKAATSGRDANVDSNNGNKIFFNFFSSNNFAGGSASWTTIVLIPIAICTSIFATFTISKSLWQKSNSSEIMLYSVANDLSSPSPDL